MMASYNDERTPYTYLIGWSELQVWYYGVRYAKGCHPSDLWVSYFTSSKEVSKMRSLHGEPDIIEVRRQFENIESARVWETTVLTRMKVVQNSKWLNKNDRLAPPIMAGDDNPSKRPDVAQAISDALTGRPKSPEHCRNLSISHIGLLKGMTYEEIHGEEAAAKLKQVRSIHFSSLPKTKEQNEKNAASQRGKRWITNGIVAQVLWPGDTLPEGFRYGRLPCTDESKKKNRDSQAGKSQIKTVSRIFDRREMTIANYIQWAENKYKGKNKNNKEPLQCQTKKNNPKTG